MAASRHSTGVERLGLGNSLGGGKGDETLKQLQIVQLLAAPWDGVRGQTYSLYGLDDRGAVYRYLASQERWEKLNMTHPEAGKGRR